MEKTPKMFSKIRRDRGIPLYFWWKRLIRFLITLYLLP